MGAPFLFFTWFTASLAFLGSCWSRFLFLVRSFVFPRDILSFIVTSIYFNEMMCLLFLLRKLTSMGRIYLLVIEA